MINTIWLRYMDLEVSLKRKKKFLLQHKDFKTMNITSKKNPRNSARFFYWLIVYAFPKSC